MLTAPKFTAHFWINPLWNQYIWSVKMSLSRNWMFLIWSWEVQRLLQVFKNVRFGSIIWVHVDVKKFALEASFLYSMRYQGSSIVKVSSLPDISFWSNLTVVLYLLRSKFSRLEACLELVLYFCGYVRIFMAREKFFSIIAFYTLLFFYFKKWIKMADVSFNLWH